MVLQYLSLWQHLLASEETEIRVQTDKNEKGPASKMVYRFEGEPGRVSSACILFQTSVCQLYVIPRSDTDNNRLLE